MLPVHPREGGKEGGRGRGREGGGEGGREGEGEREGGRERGRGREGGREKIASVGSGRKLKQSFLYSNNDSDKLVHAMIIGSF